MFIILLTAIVSVALLETILSLDNALINASLAKKLPHHLQKKALYYGILYGAVFRFLSVFIATLIISNPFIKLLGACYLIWLSYEHLFGKKSEDLEIKKSASFHLVVTQIVLASLIFSIDNIVGVTGITTNFWYLAAGILISIIVLLLLSPSILKLMHRYPSLEKASYILLTYIASTIFLDELLHIPIPEYITFLIILLVLTGTFVHDHHRMNKR